MIKPAFTEYLTEESLQYIETVYPIPVTNFVSLEDIMVLNNKNDLNDCSDEYIVKLFSFKEGITFLLNHVDQLIQREFMMYIFSSSFIDEDILIKLLNTTSIIEYADDSWLKHLAINPNIYLDKIDFLSVKIQSLFN